MRRWSVCKQASVGKDNSEEDSRFSTPILPKGVLQTHDIRAERWLEIVDSFVELLYLKGPFYGSRKVAVLLEANRKRIHRLTRILGIEALYPKPDSTIRGRNRLIRSIQRSGHFYYVMVRRLRVNPQSPLRELKSKRMTLLRLSPLGSK